MDFEKIFNSLNEEHRRATLAIIICTLILHSVFYVSSDLYRNLEWYSQIMLSLGISACYVGTFAFILFWLIKPIYLFYLSIPVLSLPAFFELCIAYRAGEFCFGRFLSVFGGCFVITLFFAIYLLIEEINGTQNNAPNKNGNNS